MVETAKNMTNPRTNSIPASIQAMSDEQLRTELLKYLPQVGPVTQSTRTFYEGQLARLHKRVGCADDLNSDGLQKSERCYSYSNMVYLGSKLLFYLPFVAVSLAMSISLRVLFPGL